MATSDESLTLEFIRHHLLEDFTSSAADSFFDNLTTLCFSDVYADKPIWSPGELESPSSSGPTPHPDSPISQYFGFSPDLFEFETKPQISMSTTTDIQDDPESPGEPVKPEPEFTELVTGSGVTVLAAEGTTGVLGGGRGGTRAYDCAAFKMRGRKAILNFPLDAGKPPPAANAGRKRRRPDGCATPSP
ncbi:UNVERIFIED_CONTAM: Ethylene-responsive transcription factor [Sesamum latifolium]|uniref:Ethylene-responsive transcription factor n=1 Tax=Sesamum latifolium TaxID=2727402 RepID=A0AAW2XEU2_9LAMI